MQRENPSVLLLQNLSRQTHSAASKRREKKRLKKILINHAGKVPYFFLGVALFLTGAGTKDPIPLRPIEILQFISPTSEGYASK